MKQVKNISSKIIIEEALNLWYNVDIISEDYDIFRITKNWKQRLFKNIDGWLDTSLSVKFALNKELTYFMLNRWKIPVPKSILIKEHFNINDIEKLMSDNLITFPVVVKPSKGSHWDGVCVNIKNYKELESAIITARGYNKETIVQDFLLWKDHRILLVNHKVIAAMIRIPAFVYWNWVNTIEELIEQENNNPERGNWHEKSLSKITIDKELIFHLQKQKLDLKTVPPKDKQIFVRENANLSTWGFSIDITDELHPEIKEMCIQASEIIGLKICWIDYLSTDITKPLSEQNGGIIEINSTPWIRGHHFPYKGKPRNVAKAILDLAFKKSN
jgi:cyanophycin synthetase